MRRQPNEATVTLLDVMAMPYCQTAYSQLACWSHRRPVTVCRPAWAHDHTWSSFVLTRTTHEVSINNLKSNWVCAIQKQKVNLSQNLEIITVEMGRDLGCRFFQVQWQPDAKPGLQFLTNTLPIIWSKSFQVPPWGRAGKKERWKGEGALIYSKAKCLSDFLTSCPPVKPWMSSWENQNI